MLTFGNMFHMTLLMPMQTRIPEWSMADRLRKAREMTGMDQIEFSEYSGISRTSITNYEQGKRSPKGLYLRAWSDATGVPVEWLETGMAPVMNDEGQLYTPRDSNPEPADYGFGVPGTAEALIELWASAVIS